MIKAEIILDILSSDKVFIQDNIVTFENMVTKINPKTLRVEKQEIGFENGIFTQQSPIVIVFPEVSMSIQDAVFYCPELLNDFLSALEVANKNSEEHSNG